MKKQTTTVAAIFSYFVLYSPQPLLPTFADEYGIGVSQAGALMTATLIPLALAPLFYGYLLSAISPSRLLRYSILCMGVSCLAFANSYSYDFSFTIRFIQGLLLPAALTAITTYIGAHSTADQLQKNMSLFITGTIIGGLFGRVLVGIFATYLSWNLFYYALAIMLLITAVSIPVERNEVKIKYAHLSLNSIFHTFAIKGVGKLYISIFCLFFSFVALLNYLPFMLKTLMESPDEMILGLMYCGFIMGAVSSLNAHRLTTLLGSAKRVMSLGYVAFLCSIAVLFIQHVTVIFLLLFLFCGSMFLVHSVAATEVNKRSPSNKSILNALYVTFYYSGGVAGSYLPGILYENFGNRAFLLCLLTISGSGLIILLTVPAVETKYNKTT
ncbi:MAG: MFS transporter [Gammaproteobacteria bacterium]|nr:MAG: MFS transporter [Gammaproteobacteria bacterium]